MLMIGISGLELASREEKQLQHVDVAGVVLFARNFASRKQVTQLIAQLRRVRPDKNFIICVDQEGGPVQRFREGFTRLPALAKLGKYWARDPDQAVELAEAHAWLMASELRAVDIDMSFAPVLDLARGNEAIGERAFHEDPEVVSLLGAAYVRGMHLAGMAASLKHFPGHGSVRADTHLAEAVDSRPLSVINAADIQPFIRVSKAPAEAVMMAHVTYPAVDALSAGQSSYWIQHILRGEMGYRGVIISDDISMVAAGTQHDVATRIKAHYDAGCDVVLACQPEVVDAAIATIHSLKPQIEPDLSSLRGKGSGTWHSLEQNPQHKQFMARICAL